MRQSYFGTKIVCCDDSVVVGHLVKMTKYLPITLSGNNLGQRHKYLNTLVNDAFQTSVPFESIQDLPELSPVDRLFKIDLASKYKNIDYIIQNLKDNDMLYVSRAMKCTWLLESQYENKINANFLEKEVFPGMITKAICKMQHWIQHRLRDPARCRDFYVYYKEKQFKIAIKFLWHCSSEYILEEFKNIVDRLEPNNLNVLSEYCPQLTRIFYDTLEHNCALLKRYLDEEKTFFGNVKFILKSDPDTFFYVIEKYFNVQKFASFGPDITKHIMINHRERFCSKPELYAAWLLDMNTIAKCLSPDEAKELVLKLARAEYLESWFTYKNVEALIKRLNKDERAAFKNLIFVDKALGDKIKNWPYTPPSSPVVKEIPGYNLFKDKEYKPIFRSLPKKMTKRCIKRSAGCDKIIIKGRTLLDDLFDRYRFMSFEATLFELRKRLRAESKMQNREFMMFVLVSKSGGRENNLRTLFALLSQYRNEPVNFRAAIIRSLVKRAFIWRIPDDMWANLLTWAHGMGLDGGPQEIICSEALHAVVLRNLLADRTSDPIVLKMFFDNFTYFTQYSLTAAERSFLRERLPKMLLTAAKLETGYEKRLRLEQLLSTLDGYNIRYDRFPGTIEAIVDAACEDVDATEYLLHSLFNARVGRKQLFKENFSLIQNNASYLNALRHDISVISIDTFKDKAFESCSRFTYEQYLRKLVTYFAESGGLAEQFCRLYSNLAKTEPNMCLAKPLSLLAGHDLTTLFNIFNAAAKKSAEKSLAGALRANGHKARPRIEVNVQSWQTVGVKAVANFIYHSPRDKREEIAKMLITSGRTIRLALSLIESSDAMCIAYKNMSTLRPGATLKMFLRYLKTGKYGSEFNDIWEIVKPLISKLDYTKRQRLLKNLEGIKPVPDSIKSEYYALVYQALEKVDKEMALRMLGNIENICHLVNEAVLTSVIKDLLNNEFVEDIISKDDNYRQQYKIEKYCLYSRLIAKFLLLCDSEIDQRERLAILEKPFFERIQKWWTGSMDKNILDYIMGNFLSALKYNKVFFDNKYVSCMAVFERVLAWLHNTLSIEKWFDMYIHLHLTMVYYKAARICITQSRELFRLSGEMKYVDKGIEMLGTVYGKLIAREYEELQSKYFQSVRKIYREEFMKYLLKSFDYATYDQSKEKFVLAMIRSILDEKEASEAHFLASHIFVTHRVNHFKYDMDLAGVVDTLANTNNNELRFCTDMESMNGNELFCLDLRN